MAERGVVLDAVFEPESEGTKSGVEVVKRATKETKCACGAVLRYGVRDVHQSPPRPGQYDMEVQHIGPIMRGGWPWIVCPECNRAVLVSGCF